MKSPYTTALRTAVMAIALLAFPFIARAQTSIIGSLSNFDVQNHTSDDTHGFEVELEGVQLNDIQYTFGEASPGGVCYIRYCAPQIIPTATGVIVRWSARWDAANQQWTSRFNVPNMPVTPSTPPAPPSLFVSGHECWSLGLGAGYPTSGCEHFGVVTTRNPSRTTYQWLVADPANPGQLVRFGGAPVAVPAPVAQVVNAGGGVQDVEAVIQAPPPASPLTHRYGKAQWVKVYKTEIDRRAHLDALVGGHPEDIVPNGDNAVAETEWKLLQLDTTNPDKGGSELRSHGGSNSKSHSVVRRYEFYEYTGPVVTPGGTSKGGLLNDDKESSQCTRDVNGDCLAPAPGDVGNFIGAQMAAQNLAHDGELDQSIVFGALVDRHVGDAPIALAATGGGSGNPVTFSTVGACRVDASNMLSLDAAGGCVVIASQAGNDVYAPAADEIRSFIINKGGQAIAFGPLAGGHRFGDAPFQIGATGGASPNPVTFTAAGACSVSGTTVTITAAGLCSITASQAGDANFDAAADVVQATTIAKGIANVTFDAATLSQVYDATTKTVAAATDPAGLTLTLSFTGTPLNAGSYPVTATIDDANFEGTASATLTIARADQALVFGALPNRTFGDAPFTVSATPGASSSPVLFAAGGACTIAGNLVTLTGAGSCTITASQAADANYNAAPDVPRTFTIAAPPPPPSADVLVNPGAQHNAEGDEVELRLQLNDPDGTLSTRRNEAGDDRRPRGVFTAANLPADLHLEKEQGVIRGHVRKGAAGVYQVTVTFTSRAGATFSQTFTWTVVAASQKEKENGRNK